MRSLVILTDNFGLNFSGGAIATCRTFETIEDEFREIIVIAERVGQHNFTRLQWKPYRSTPQALKHIYRLKQEQEKYIFFGDFYMTYYYRLIGIPYFFAYHDSWPEQWELGWKFKRKGLFFIPVYRWVIQGARGVITVSDHKGRFVKELNEHSIVVRNGLNTSNHKTTQLAYKHGVFKIIMLGNVSDLKFGYALSLFQKIQNQGFLAPLQIDIFGNITDNNLAKKLNQFDFVQLKGFNDNIIFTNYHLLLKTSKMENLSIAVVEAISNFTPVVCFDVGGLREVVQHGKNGLLVPARDVKEMYNALVRAVEGIHLFDFSMQDLSEYNWNKAGRFYFDFFTKTI